MPLPGTADDLFQLTKLRLPPQLAPNFIAIGNQSRGIARATLADCLGNAPSRHGPRRLNHLPDTEPTAVPKVVSTVIGLNGTLRQ